MRAPHTVAISPQESAARVALGCDFENCDPCAEVGGAMDVVEDLGVTVTIEFHREREPGHLPDLPRAVVLEVLVPVGNAQEDWH